MALSAKVGSFTKPNATGAQVITGLGFTPKVIIFWGTGGITSATWRSSIFAGIGFTTGPANSYACAIDGQDAVATSATHRRIAAKCFSQIDWNGGLHEADLTSFDADGFTLTWGTDTSGVSFQINYLALGGTDITNAKVVSYAANTGTALQSVTGVGFKPDLVFHALNGAGAPPSGATSSRMCFGVMNKHGQQWGNSTVSLSGVNPADCSRFQQNDACLAMSSPDGASIHGQAHFVSMDPDGFSYVWSTVFGGGYVLGLCIKGISSKIGALLKPTAAPPAVQSVVKVGFTPKAVLFTDVQAFPEAASPETYAYWHVGASDGSTHRLAGYGDRDAISPTVAKSFWRNDAAVGTVQNIGTIDGAAALTSMDADGFTLTWNPNPAYATEHLYLALGDAGVDTYPTRVA